MSAMIEKVARIVADSAMDCCGAPKVPCCDTCECVVNARKIIEVMREPTQAMLNATSHPSLLLADQVIELRRSMWKYMIDEALK